jgi:ribonuclease III
MITKLLENFGITISNPKLLQNALIHRSYLNENKTEFTTSYERLEFLGDSVLSLITSQYLFLNFPDLQEGAYTDIKAAIVRTESLADAARRLEIGQYLLLSGGEEQQMGRDNDNTLADTFESIIAVIFLDNGFTAAQSFVEQALFKYLNIEHLIEHKLYLSPKNRLQELSQKTYKQMPEYVTLKEEGPEHKKTFTISVSITPASISVIGIGKSKKQAEELAAKEALKQLENIQ